MSKGDYIHLHRDSAPGTVVYHDPDGLVIGYIARVRVIGQSRPGFVPLDKNRKPLAGYQDTRERALDFVAEQ
jgi:hypothetical protein